MWIAFFLDEEKEHGETQISQSEFKSITWSQNKFRLFPLFPLSDSRQSRERESPKNARARFATFG